MKCYNCKEDREDGWPYHQYENNIYCPGCAFKLSLITEKSYISLELFSFGFPLRACIVNGEIIITLGKKSYLEIRKSDYRNHPLYQEWRHRVFTRDNYTCKDCNVKSVPIQAHHIKPYKKHEDLRFELSNGLTLCIPCHKTRHKRVQE